MDSQWAVEQIQVIRTLMERSALYRRALAPVMLSAGAFGCIAGAGGWFLKIDRPQTFLWYWIGVAVLALAGSLLIVRKQALTAGEVFWSPPARRVFGAAAPSLFIGLLLTLVVSWKLSLAAFIFIPILWIFFYGVALHSAGFFTRRGLRLFGLIFMLMSLVAAVSPLPPAGVREGHALMGGCFGLLHLAWGFYLYATEGKKD